MGKNDDSGDEGFPSHKDESGFVKTFPQRLFELLESVNDDPSNESITWSATGDSFMIVDQAAFVDKLLPKFFKRTKFTSFKGKLYRWGFRRVGKGYFHKLFLRDNPTLCLHMRRQMKGKNTDDIVIPPEALTAPPIMPSKVTLEPEKTVKKSKAKPKANKKNNKEKSMVIPQTPLSINDNTYAAVGQLGSSHLSNGLLNAGPLKGNLTNSSFLTSKSSSQAILNTQSFSGMLSGSPQDITRALVEEGEGIEEEEYMGAGSLQSGYLRNHSDATMNQIANRLSNSNIDDDVLRNSSLQSNVTNHFPQPTSGLLNMHRNMYKDIMMMPTMNSISASNQMSQWNQYSQQRKKLQQTANRLFSKNRQNIVSFPQSKQQFRSQKRGGTSSEWRMDNGANSGKSLSKLGKL